MSSWVIAASLSAGLAACSFDPPRLPRAEDCATSADYSSFPGGGRYRLIEEEMSFDAAFAACSVNQAHPVVITSDEENKRVRGFIDAEIWLGIDDLESEGEFVRVDGEPLVYDNWSEDEPRQAQGDDCAMMSLDEETDGQWQTLPCRAQRQVVCECSSAFQPPPVPACMTDESFDLSFQGRRYRFENTRRTRQEAQDDCAATGAHLIVINDASENGGARLFALDEDVWLGYDDIAVENDFQWITGSPNPFEAWAQGEPNNTNNDEDCVELGREGLWNDQECVDTNSYICECDPSAGPF